MSRFGSEQDDLFRRINASISFDWRLAPYDIRQSRAHARALARLGVLSDDELSRLLEALDQVEGELSGEEFAFQDVDEDIHMAVERRVTEIAGEPGAKLHTGRSRNDQVVTDLALFVRDHAERCLALTRELLEVLLELAERHADWPIPAYTHLQRAQPVYLGHHLLAFFWMLERDARRFSRALESTSDMAAGSGALAGSNWELDRESLAAELDFARPYPNSLDAVSNRDFAIDHLYACAVCAMHLSRLGADLVLWCTREFGFAEPDDSFASGSSIMPQKKNPDAAELLRGKAPRISAALFTLLGMLHGLPLAYSKDMQEDKEPLFDATDNLELCLQAAAGMLATLTFDRERLEAAAGDEFLAATDLADMLVQEGVPFRDAHGIVGGIVRTALEQDKLLSELDDSELVGVPEGARERFRETLREGATIEAKVSVGGTSSRRLGEQFEAARAALADLGG